MKNEKSQRTPFSGVCSCTGGNLKMGLLKGKGHGVSKLSLWDLY